MRLASHLPFDAIGQSRRYRRAAFHHSSVVFVRGYFRTAVGIYEGAKVPSVEHS